MKSSDNGFDPALIDEWVKIWNSYNLSMVDDLFLADSRVTYFSSEKEGVIKGIDALRDHHRGFGFVEGGKCQPNRLWLEDIHIEDFGQWPSSPQFGASIEKAPRKSRREL